MFAVYAKDEDRELLCSDRYQETECLGVFSTLTLVKRQIEYHKKDILMRNTAPRVWGYYVYACELDQSLILKEECRIKIES